MKSEKLIIEELKVKSELLKVKYENEKRRKILKTNPEINSKKRHATCV
jgi:hypothetical protein